MRKIYKNYCSLFMALVLALTFVFSSFTSPAFAYENIDLNLCKAERVELGSRSITRIYSPSKELLAETEYDEITGVMETHDYVNGINVAQKVDLGETIQSMADNHIQLTSSGSYKYVTSHSGSFTVAGISAAAITTIILAHAPGVGWATALKLANILIQSGCSGARYTVDLYAYTKNGVYHAKRVFKVYNKSTGKKIGPDLVGYATSHN